jgi:hypothetical protein
MNKRLTITVPSLYQECLDCTKALFITTPPNDRYADTVARLMVGTIAQESRFYYRRQTVFNWDSKRGAWGLGQMEISGVKRALSLLKAQPVLADRAGKWLFGQDDDDMAILNRICTSMSEHDLCRLVSGWDRLSVALMRLYYLDCPGAVPDTLPQQAEYYKRHWNTYAGKATTGQYIDNWNRLCEPNLKGIAA